MNVGEFTARVQQAYQASPYIGKVECQRTISVTVECLANSTVPLYTHVVIQEQIADLPLHQYRFDEHVKSVSVLEILWALQLVYATYHPDEEVLQYVETHQQRFCTLTPNGRPADAGEGLERPLPDALAGHHRSPLTESAEKFRATYSRHRRRIG